MKNLFLTVFFATLLFVSCNNEEFLTTFKVGIAEKFQQGEMNQSDDNSLKFSITEINDSRCPSDVICVWQGEADVKIEFELPQTGFVVLSTYDNLIDTFGTYSFELIDVLPYPISTKTIKLEDYDVTLKIKELE
ncbi:MAG: hypothetical protein L3J11_00935 [Draconibacterium sp.]|nr:hypothetical protein [Draconibacterium sp.]